MRRNSVLLVEDDPADVKLIRRAFTKAEVDAAVYRLSDGEEAISYLDGAPPYSNRVEHPFPAVLLIDLKLPRRNGLEVLEWLRSRDDSRRRLPVIMLTSSRHLADVNRAYDLGVNSYVTKPDTGTELTEFVSRFRQYWFTFNEEPEIAL